MIFLRLLLEMNLLLALGYFVVRWGGFKHLPAPFRLRLSQALFLLCLALPWGMIHLPRSALTPPAVQVFSGATAAAPLRFERATEALAPFIPSHTSVSLASSWALFLLGIWLAGAALFLLKTFLEMWRLRRNLGNCFKLLTVGRVSLVLSDDSPGPFSAGFWDRAFVLLPYSFVQDPKNLRLAVSHELQHFRQRDLEWIYFFATVRSFFFFNPFLSLWNHWFLESQELACDAALIHEKGVNVQAYGRCLLEAAQIAVKSRTIPAGAAGMASSVSASILKRRILMLKTPNASRRRWPALLVFSAGMLVITSMSYASRSWLQEGTLTLNDVQAAIARVESDGAIPLVVNEYVLEELNYFLGTPKGRQWVRNTLARMPAYVPLIEGKMETHKMPRELMAVPFVESGFANLAATSTEPSEAPGFRGAGLWMFIVQTARRYGLIINEEIDERLDVEKETVAGMRYLKDLHTRFKNWELAIAAYNHGEHYVEKQIKLAGHSDPWKLVGEGKLNRYLSKVMAGLIILKCPSLQP